jgi:sulfite reductase (NADPH) hemoprotein beta-component
MQIVTANRLGDGRVVYRDPTGRWSESVAAAAVLDAEAAARALTAAEDDVAARRIVAPYAVDVVMTGGTPTPRTMREKIRAAGPTTVAPAAPRPVRAA